MNQKLEVLITSGGTAAKIDDVRHLGNFSSGTTGALIAEEFLKNNYIVHYVYGKNAKRPFLESLKMNPKKPKAEELERLALAYENYNKYSSSLVEYPIFTFEEYFDNVKNVLTRESIAVAVLAAAVGDYGYDKKEGKISSDKDKLVLEFHKNPKVISLIQEWSPKVYQVGFKLLSKVSDIELIEKSYKHGMENHSDLIVANSINDGDFGNRSIFLITKYKEVVRVNEKNLAAKVVEYVNKGLFVIEGVMN
jgi:phosphopantothenate--cysteine ligase